MNENLEGILLQPNTSIKNALEVIDKNGLRSVLVVAENRELLGIVTDGDIRRGILKSLSLEDEISLIMKKDPIVATKLDSKETLKNLMTSKSIFVIPIVDQGIVVGVETLASVSAGSQFENPVFLMAGGFGKRLRPLTDNCPKPLLKVGSKPILETTIVGLRNNGFKNFYISTHYLANMIEDYFGNGEKWDVNIKYIHEDSPLGTGGALNLLPSDIEPLPLIVMNGDILTNMNFKSLLQHHNSNAGRATICVREYEYQVPYGVIQSDGKSITSMVEKPVQRFHVNAGVYVLEPSILSSLTKDEVIDMPCLLEKEIQNGQEVLVYPIHDYWLDIGQIEDFNRAQNDIKCFWNE